MDFKVSPNSSQPYSRNNCSNMVANFIPCKGLLSCFPYYSNIIKCLRKLKKELQNCRIKRR